MFPTHFPAQYNPSILEIHTRSPVQTLPFTTRQTPLSLYQIRPSVQHYFLIESYISHSLHRYSIL